MGDTVAEWLSPQRRRVATVLSRRAQPLVLVCEAAPVLAPLVHEYCALLRVRAETTTPAMLGSALREHAPVGVLVHAPHADRTVAQALRAIAAADPALPVLVVIEHDIARDARLTVAHEIIRLEHLVWVNALPDLRRMVDFLFLAERQASRGRPLPA